MEQHARTRPILPSLVLAAVACLAAEGRARAQPPKVVPEASARTGDEAAIRAATGRYLAALSRGDGKALADMWTPDGDIIDDEGRVTNGREAVAGIVPADGPRRAPTIKETRLRFVTPDVAIEDGIVTVAPPDGGAPHEGWFSATWVRRQDEGWRLAGLRESRIASPHDAPTLADLSWMVGDWTVAEDHAAGEGDQGPRPHEPRIELSVRWNPTRTFLIRELSITPPPGAAGAAAAPTQITQRIGWDPLSRRIVSWVFGSDGSHGEAIWSREDGTWIARTRSVLPDGTQTSSLNIYAYDGADRCAWRSIPTHVGGEHAPHVSMTMIRKGPALDRGKEDGR